LLEERSHASEDLRVFIMKNAKMKEDDKSWRIEYLEPASVPHHEDNDEEEEESKEKNESKEEDKSLQD